MQLWLPNATVYDQGVLTTKDMMLDHDQWIEVFSHSNNSIISLPNAMLVPGFLDVHVHLREPGFSYKEHMATGTQSGVQGGYTALCAMPNLNPAPDCNENIKVQQDIIDKNAVIPVYPYGCITKGGMGRGELCDFEAMKPHVIAFSDDGKGVQSESLMREAMQAIHRVGGMVVAHCEDESFVAPGGCIHDGAFAKEHGYIGITSESEWKHVERDVRLSKETGCAYHVCHVSTKESVAIIRKAKAEGVNVTCETAPHYLLLTEDDLQHEGRFKMNPPIRSKADREALIEGLLDGTIDILATDHAPHSAEEKAKGLANSMMGIVGLETAFPLLYTGLVKTGIVPLLTILRAMIDTPRARFGLPKATLQTESTVFTLDTPHCIDPTQFASMGHATPFAGYTVQAQCEITILGGKILWQRQTSAN